MIDYILLILGWAIYFFLHSVLATDRVKSASGLNPRTYRLIYSIFATAGLVGLLFFNGWLGGERMFIRTEFIKYAGLFLAGGGVLVINAAFRNYSLRSFLGLAADTPGETLVTNGINAWVRHPLYSGTILITAGYFLFDPRLSTLISVGCIWLYLVIGIRLEERKLIDKFGDRYRAYRDDVAAVIPFLL